MTVRVVLVEPTHPGNIGAVARAMGNMGVSDLCMVRPVDFRVEEARVRSAKNEGILASAKEFESLAEAIADCSFVIGTSARLRTIGWPNLSPRAAMAQVAEVSEHGGQAALVFGPERAGLSNSQIDQCDVLVRIPVSDTAPSINLAGSVLILLYELRCIQLDNLVDDAGSVNPEPKRKEDTMATRKQVQGFFEHLFEVMENVEFIAGNPRDILKRKIRRIFLRPGLTEDEVNILRGFLKSVGKKAAQGKTRSD
ncbi:MAG: RNA methyltransferase [Acidiferrobacterales bacterium]|nr:RNA methyltransferase [Acidiferrobacterales bacterium]